MNQTLLSVLFLFFSFAAFSQASPDGSENAESSTFPKLAKVSVYPNPATNYISIDNDDNVKQIAVFNLVGKKLKSFQNVEKDERYDVSELPHGMYLVQIIDHSNKIVTTQRISKR